MESSPNILKTHSAKEVTRKVLTKDFSSRVVDDDAKSDFETKLYI